MATNDEQLSPEEKLLQVIQGEGNDTAEASEAPQAQGTAEVPAEQVTAAESTPKPKLKLAKESAAASLPEDEEVTRPAVNVAAVAVEPEMAAGVGDASPAMAASVLEPSPSMEEESPATGEPSVVPITPLKRETHGLEPIRFTNRTLSLVIAAVVGLIAFELWASSRPVEEHKQNVPLLAVETSPFTLPKREALQARFKARDIFDVIPFKTTDVNRPPDDPVPAYLKNFKLIGISALPDGSYEAIVVDNNNGSGRMHFARQGQSIPVVIPRGPHVSALEKEIAVDSIYEDHLNLMYQGEKIEIR